MKKLILAVLLASSLLAGLQANVLSWDPSTGILTTDGQGSISSPFINEKMYINVDEMVASEEAFHIHEESNRWIQINTLHSDSRGFYILESDIVKSHDGGYEKKWRCPYCNSYWPLGKPCQNPDCPSRYK